MGRGSEGGRARRRPEGEMLGRFGGRAFLEEPEPAGDLKELCPAEPRTPVGWNRHPRPA